MAADAPVQESSQEPDLQTDGEVDRAFTEAMKSAGQSGGEPAATAEETKAPEAPQEPVQTELQATETQPTAGQSEAEQPPEPAFSDQLREAAVRLGLTVDDGATAEDLALAALQQLHSAKPLMTFAQQALASQPQQPQAPQAEQPKEWTPESYFQEKYGGPQWQPQFTQAINSGMLVRDTQTNLWKPAPGYEVMAGGIVNQVNEAERHTQQMWQDLGRSNPYQRFYENLLEPMQRAWKADMESFVAQQQQATTQKSTIEQFEQQNASWLYRDDPVSGGRVLTDKGQSLFNAISDIRSKGVTDPETLLELASLKAGIQSGAPSQVAAKAEAPSQPQAGQAAEQPASQAPSPPQAATNGESQAPQQSFLESALRRASHSPSANGHSSEASPPAMTEGDLNSMFVQAFRSR